MAEPPAKETSRTWPLALHRVIAVNNTALEASGCWGADGFGGGGCTGGVGFNLKSKPSIWEHDRLWVCPCLSHTEGLIFWRLGSRKSTN